jgi:hypothetical protein
MMSGYPVVIPAVAGLSGRAALSRAPAPQRAIAGSFAVGGAAAALLMSSDPMDYPAWLGPSQQFFGFLPALPAALGAAYLFGWSFGTGDPAWQRILSVLCALATLLPLLGIFVFVLIYRE